MSCYRNELLPLPSKLEVCVAIMKLLAQKGPQTSGQIEASITTKAGMVRECLGLLIEQRLLEKGTNHNNLATYANTKRSERVLEFFYVKVQARVKRYAHKLEMP